MMTLSTDVLQHARVLWDYNLLHQPPEDADLLLVMGHNDLGVPRCAAELALRYNYQIIVVTGGVFHENSPSGEIFGGLEADVFKREMVRLGVDESRILVEDKAQNTGDNITMARGLLTNRILRTGQLVHMPVMQRRAYATATQQWPDMTWRVTAERADFKTYIASRLKPENMIAALVGDTSRIISYPALGFQTPQEMPDNVLASLDALLKRGYGSRLPAA